MDDSDLLNYDVEPRCSMPSTGSNAASRALTITRSARMIFSAYRRDDFADPEMFILQLGTILERYSDEVIAFVSGPLTGIQRKCKFPPAIAEIVEMCDGEADAIARRARYAAMPKYMPMHRPLVRRHRANCLVHQGAPQYEAMVARSKAQGTSDQDWRSDPQGRGIWVAYGWLDDDGDRRLGNAAARVATR